MSKNVKSVDQILSETKYTEKPKYMDPEFIKSVVEEGNYSYHVGKFYDAYNGHISRVLNQEKRDRYEVIRGMVEDYFDGELETSEFKTSEDGLEVRLTLLFEMAISRSEETHYNVSDVLAALFTEYKDTMISVSDGTHVKMEFTIKLYDELKIKEIDCELEELMAKCKIRMNQNLDMNQ